MTYMTFLIGALALCAIPPFSGFYSKDVIIEAVKLSHVTWRKLCLLLCLGRCICHTTLYFPRIVYDFSYTRANRYLNCDRHIQESPWVVLVPLVLLAIPSVMAGQMLIGPNVVFQSMIIRQYYFCVARA